MERHNLYVRLLLQINILANKLVACGAAIDENDLILHTLDGVLVNYRPIQNSYNT